MNSVAAWWILTEELKLIFSALPCDLLSFACDLLYPTAFQQGQLFPQGPLLPAFHLLHWVPTVNSPMKTVLGGCGERKPSSAVGSMPRRTPLPRPLLTATNEGYFIFCLPVKPVSFDVPRKEVGRCWDASGIPFYLSGVLKRQLQKCKEALFEKFPAPLKQLNQKPPQIVQGNISTGSKHLHLYPEFSFLQCACCWRWLKCYYHSCSYPGFRGRVGPKYGFVFLFYFYLRWDYVNQTLPEFGVQKDRKRVSKRNIQFGNLIHTLQLYKAV